MKSSRKPLRMWIFWCRRSWSRLRRGPYGGGARGAEHSRSSAEDNRRSRRGTCSKFPPRTNSCACLSHGSKRTRLSGSASTSRNVARNELPKERIQQGTQIQEQNVELSTDQSVSATVALEEQTTKRRRRKRPKCPDSDNKLLNEHAKPGHPGEPARRCPDPDIWTTSIPFTAKDIESTGKGALYSFQ